MAEKRYFKKMWEGEFYIFDSNTISESDFEEKLEYQDYKAFEDSMTGEDVVNRLNELTEENEQSKIMITTLRNIVLENEDLEKENKALKRKVKETVFDIDVLIDVSAPNTERISLLLDLKEKIIETFGEWVIEYD